MARGFALTKKWPARIAGHLEDRGILSEVYAVVDGMDVV